MSQKLESNNGKKFTKLKNKKYEKELRKLQAKLCHLQEWVKHKGLRVMIVFEGRDAAGKGGTIRAITERVSPRVFRVVALPAPSNREKSQMYVQRYIAHSPAAGEIVIFDRSWYNRAGVEYVMGFCSKEQHRLFLERCPEIETNPGGTVAAGQVTTVPTHLNRAPSLRQRSRLRGLVSTPGMVETPRLQAKRSFSMSPWGREPSPD